MPTGQLGIPDQQRFPQLLLPGGIDVVLGVGGSNPLLTPCESPARRLAVWTLKPCPSWSFEWGPGGPVGLAPAITGMERRMSAPDVHRARHLGWRCACSPWRRCWCVSHGVAAQPGRGQKQTVIACAMTRPSCSRRAATWRSTCSRSGPGIWDPWRSTAESSKWCSTSSPGSTPMPGRTGGLPGTMPSRAAAREAALSSLQIAPSSERQPWWQHRR